MAIGLFGTETDPGKSTTDFNKRADRHMVINQFIWQSNSTETFSILFTLKIITEFQFNLLNWGRSWYSIQSAETYIFWFLLGSKILKNFSRNITNLLAKVIFPLFGVWVIINQDGVIRGWQKLNKSLIILTGMIYLQMHFGWILIT